MRDKKGIIDVTGEKAGNKPKKPYRAEAAATTKQRMRITYGLTEGTALGFGRNFTENDMLKRIFLDGTPIMSSEGDKLLDVIVEFRNGSRDQPVINGLPSVTVENEVNVEVTQSSPVSRSFNRIENTSYDIRVSVPQLFDGDEQGNQRKGLIQFKVEVSTGGGAFAPAGTFEINERIVNGWSQTYNIKVASAAQHTIRISRLNSENVNEFSANTLVVESIVEVTDVKLTYPNTALLYLEYDAEQFSNIPKLEVRLFGKSDILIPANYDPVTRSYSTTGTGTTGGVWNGSFKRDYTDNPVWIWLDLVVSKRYGLGDKVTLDMVDKWQLYAVAQYCDQLVSDGKGGQEPRFTCNNLYLQKSEDAFKVLKDIASIFRSTTVWTGDQFTALADIPRDPVMTFSAANAKEIIYSSVNDSAQHNLVNAQYYDKDNKFTSRVTMKRDKENILRRDKVVDVQFTAIGCTSEGQAQRAAKYLLVSELNETELVSFTTGLEGALLRLNDVFYLADDAIAGRVTSGRVVAISGANVTLDRPIPAGLALAGATKLVLNRDDISTSPVNVIAVSQDRTVVTLAAAPPATTGVNLVWALITQDVVPQQFRVTDIKFNEDDLNYSISGIKYNKSKYAAIDDNARIINPPISIVENKLLKAPLTVVATYNVRIVQDINVSDCYVSWSQSENAISYQVEMQKDDDEWRIISRFTSLATTLENLYNGVYRFRVCAIDTIGNMSQYTYSAPLAIAGKTFPPPSLTSYTVAGILFGFQHNWSFPSGVEDSRAVRIRKAILDPAANPTQPLTNFDVAYPANTYTETNVAANTVCWFSAAIVDKYGVVGAWSSWVQATVDNSPDKIMDVLEGHIGLETLSQDLKDSLTMTQNTANQANTVANAANTAAQLAQTAASNAQTAANTAQTAANTAQTAANNAKTAADAAQTTANTANTTATKAAADITKEISDRIAAVSNESTARIAAINALNDGLTTETQQRKDADSSLSTTITNNKASTDSAIANVQTQVTSQASTISSQATQITSLDSRLTTNETATTQASAAAATAQTTANTAVDLANAASSQTTALRAELSTGNGVNIILAPFSDPQTVPTMAGSLRTVTLVPSPLRRNGKAYNIAFTANTATVYFGSSSVGSAPNGMGAAMTAGAKYMLSLWIKSTSGAVPNLKANVLYFRRDPATGTITTAGGVLTPQGTTNTSFALDTTGRRISFKSLTAPSNTIGATYYLTGDNAVPAASGEYVVDWLMAEAALGDDKPASTWVAGSADLGVINDSLTANANAISSLTTRVTTAEGGISSNSTAITGLQNSLTTTNNNVALKADQTALNSLDSKVTTQGNTITSQGNSITSLQGSVATINTTLSTKADNTAVTALTGRVTATESGITNLNAATTALSASIAAIGNDSLIPDFETKNADSWISHYGHNIAPMFVTTTTGLITNTVVRKDSTTTTVTPSWIYSKATLPNDRPYKVSMYVRRNSAATGTYYFTIGLYDATGARTNYTQAQIALSEIPADENWYLIERTINLTANAAKRLSFGFALNHNSGNGYAEMQGYRVRNIISSTDTDSTIATAAAVSTLSNTVTQQGTSITTNSNDITSLKNSLTTTNNNVALKADQTALNSLSSTVTTQGNTITTQGNSITTLQGNITTINNSLATKVDSSTLVNYYNKTQADAATAGAISTFNASLVIGGVNAVADSEAERTSTAASNKEYLMYERSAYLKSFYDENLNKQITISFELSVPVAGVVQVYSSNSSAHAFTAPVTVAAGDVNKFVRYSVTVTVAAHPTTPTAANSTLEFFGTYSTGRIPTVRKVQVEAGNKATAWSPSPRDVQSALDANASAISGLSSTVTTQGNTITSQGTAITTLQNNLATTNSNVALKADQSALNTLDSKVTTQGNTITSQGNSITTLQGNITTINNELATKATTSALNSLGTRVTTAENNITSQGNSITSLNNALTVTTTTANNALPKITPSDNAYKLFRSVLTYENNAVNLAGNIVIQTPITLSAKMFKVTGTGYNYSDAATDISFTIGAYAYNSTSIIRHSAANTGTVPLRMRLGIRNGAICIILTSQLASNLWQYPKLSLDAEIGYTLPPDSWQNGWSAAVVLEADLATYGVTNIVEPSLLDVKTEIRANSSAISSLDSTVTQQGNTITSQGTSITNLQNSIATTNANVATKAAQSSLDALSSTVTTQGNTITSQGNSITTLQGNLTTTNNNVALKADTTTVNALSNRVTATEGDITAINTAVTSLNASIKAANDSITMSASIDIDPNTEWYFVANNGGVARANDVTALGGKTYRFGDGTGNDHVNVRSVAKIPFDPNRLYRIKIRYKRNTGTGTIYAAICTLANDGTSHVNASNTVSTNFSSANYFVSAANPTNNVWQETTVYVKGRAAGAATGNWTIDNPRQMPNATAFLSLQFLANYSAAAGTVDLDFMSLEDSDALGANAATASAVTSLDTRVTSTEGTVSSQATQLTSLSSTVGSHTTSIQTQSTTIDGINAKHTVKINNNGAITGYGLISTANNAVPTSAFVVTADAFAIYSPTANKSPFVVIASANQVVDGETYPEVGTYMRNTFQSKASIGTAHIKDANITEAKIASLAVTNAKIANLAVTTGKIADLSVETIKIKNNAVTVPFGYIDTTVVQGNMPANQANNQEILLSSVTASGFSQYGTVQVFIQSDASFWWDNGIIQWQGSAEAKIELRDLIWNDLYADFGYAEPYEYWETDESGIGRYIQVGRLATARRSGTLMFTVQANVNGEVKLKLLGSWTNSIQSSMQMYWSHKRTSWFMQEVKK